MNILFYPPFKPLDHPTPSGDLVIATGLYDFLADRGHRLTPIRSLRTRWIYWKPWLWPGVLVERLRIGRMIRKRRPDIWLTYHTYYKAPDVIGPAVCRRRRLPYVVFQGIYSTKRRKRLKTRPGFALNKRALEAAGHVFTNRLQDLQNLSRIIPSDRLTYIPPGIYPEEFNFDPRARAELRRTWNAEALPVIVTAAMFRPGVKTDGLMWVIRACESLRRQGLPAFLAIAGDGPARDAIRDEVKARLGDRFVLLGQVPRSEMFRVYSAGDLFAFPGFRESLGMVFLEAQACGRPVVACRNGGVPEVVKDGETGFLTPLYSFETFVLALEVLIRRPELRRSMGEAAAAHVRRTHDLHRNYRTVETVLEDLLRRQVPETGA